MDDLKAIFIIILGILGSVNGDRFRGGGGWGSRPSGNGHRVQNHNGWNQQRGNNNNWGHQQPYGNNRNFIHYNNQNPHVQPSVPAPAVSTSCSRPAFTDDAKLVIEKCGRERYQPACWNSTSDIPIGWKVYMDCRKGPLIMQYPSTCSESGEWTPELHENCDSLFEFAKARPLMSGGQCSMLKMDVSENFIFACFLPDSALEAADCHTLSKVPSGTTAMLKCKPPFQSQDGRNSEWRCDEGSWKGDFTHRLKCFYSTQVANPVDHGIGHGFVPTTTTPQFELPNIPIFPIEPRPTPSPPMTTIKTNPPTHRTTTTTTTTQAPYIPPSTARPRTTTTRPNPGRPPMVKPSEVTCPPLKARSPGIKLECVSKAPSGSEIFLNTCNVPQPVGSEASYSCKSYYESTAGLSTLYRKCKENGTFTGSAETFNCVVECGRNNPLFVPFITSGQLTLRGQWPWHAAMFLKETADGGVKWTYICGGTLISRRAILTASHCVTFIQSSKVRDPAYFRLDLGRFERENVDDIIQMKKVASIHVHPSYSPFGYDSDIAIVILQDDVTIGYHVRPICFPQTLNSALEELQLSESSVGTVVGWGYNENSQLANELQMAELKVGSQKDCSDSARGIETGSIQAKSTTFCAKNKNGSLDVNVCNGDSGGGMYFPLKNTEFTRWYLQGVVSVGVADDRGKCKPSQYSVFTRVGRYADWIVRVLSESDAL